MKKFIFRKTLQKVDSVKKLLKIDPLNVNTHRPPPNINVGFSARALALEYNRNVSHKVSSVLKFQKGAWLCFQIFHHISLKNHHSKTLLCDMLSVLIRFIWKAIDVMQKTNLLFFCKSCWHLKDYHLLRLQSRLKSNLEL